MSEAFKSEYMAHTLPHPKQLNIWACFAASGLGYCHIHNDAPNGKSFTRILDANLLPSADLLFTETPRQLWWFLQHNAPTHRANVAQAWLPNQGVNSVEFPPSSPDLNPIENLWQHLEKRAEERASRKQSDLQDVIAEK